SAKIGQRASSAAAEKPLDDPAVFGYIAWHFRYESKSVPHSFMRDVRPRRGSQGAISLLQQRRFRQIRNEAARKRAVENRAPSHHPDHQQANGRQPQRRSLPVEK